MLGCAALPWLVGAAMRYRRDGRRADLGAAVAWSALASLTPTGGLLAVAGLLVAGTPHVRRLAPLLAGGLLLQAPWVVAARDRARRGRCPTPPVSPCSRRTRSRRTARSWHSSGSGGIWDAGSEPATRTTWLAVVAAAVVVVVLLAGLPGLRRAWGTGDTVRWVVLAAVPAAVALAAATSWGSDVLVQLVESVPGAGLLRDTQKLMAPAAVLAAAAFGAVAQRVHRALRR